MLVLPRDRRRGESSCPPKGLQHSLQNPSLRPPCVGRLLVCPELPWPPGQQPAQAKMHLLQLFPAKLSQPSLAAHPQPRQPRQNLCPSRGGPKGEPAPPRGARAAPTRGCPLPSWLRAAPRAASPSPGLAAPRHGLLGRSPRDAAVPRAGVASCSGCQASGEARGAQSIGSIAGRREDAPGEQGMGWGSKAPGGRGAQPRRLHASLRDPAVSLF